MFLAAASRLLSGASRPSFFIRPDTLLGWHRQLVRRRWNKRKNKAFRVRLRTVMERDREILDRLAR